MSNSDERDFGGGDREIYRIILEILSYLCGATMLIYAILRNVQLYSRKHEMFMNKRTPFLHFALNVSTILIIPSWYCVLLAHWFGLMAITIAIIPAILFFLLSMGILLAKNWMIFYKYFWTEAILASKWQKIINSKEAESDWFIVNNAKYGNVKFVSKCIGYCMLTICSVSITILIIAAILGPKSPLFQTLINMFTGIAMLSYVALIIFYGIIVKKTPNIDDVYYIHWESRQHSKYLFLFFFSMIVTQLFNTVFVLNQVGNFGINGHDCWIFMASIYSIWFFLMNDASTKQITRKVNEIDFEREESFSESTMVPSMNKRSSIPSKSKEKVQKIRLRAVLSHKISIHTFMLHLSKEYSMELLLAAIEFVQFQQYLLPHLDENDYDLHVQKLVKFPSNVPQSLIVRKDIEDEDISQCDDVNDEFLFYAKLKALKLYEKYIADNSEYEINIAYDERVRLMQFFCDKATVIAKELSLKELFFMFEASKQEMFNLLKHSLQRLRHNYEEWSKIKEEIMPSDALRKGTLESGMEQSMNLVPL